MPWVRIDEEFPLHPKVLTAGPLGMAMQVAALCYCNRYLTDGFVSQAVIPGLLNLEGLGMRHWMGELVGGGQDATWQLVIEDLLAAGLWDEEKGGYRIHDFHDFQPSREATLKLRADRSAAGQKGGLARSQASAKQVLEQTPSKRSSKTQAKSKPVPVPQDQNQELQTIVEQARPVAGDVERIFDHWRISTGKSKASLNGETGKKRRTAIQRALRDYPLEDLLDAVYGWKKDPWPDRPLHNDVTVLLRDAEHIEKFRDLWRDGPPATTANGTRAARHRAQIVETHQQLDAWAKEMDGNAGDGLAVDRGQAQCELPRPGDRA